MTKEPSVVYREWAQVAMPSRVDAVADAVEPLRHYLAQRGAPAEAMDAVRLAVTEALTNAVAHGQGPSVCLDWSWQDEWLDAKISEPGFFEAPPDWHELPDDDLVEGGRGGFLITQLMDSAVHTNAHGQHTLHLRKRLGFPTAPGAPAEDLDRTLAAMTEDLSTSYEVLSALFRLGEALATSADLAEFAQHALQLRQLVEADAMSIRLVDASHQLVPLAAAGDQTGAGPLPASAACLEARVFRDATEQTIDDRHALPPDDPLHAPAGSGFVCPIVFQGRTHGVCVIVRHRAGVFFTAGQLSLARTLTEFLGIACANAELQAQRRKQLQAQRELEIAAQIQQSLVPTKFPTGGAWRMHGSCVNAQEVGGDFFDVIEVPDGVLLVIADVMGKGVPAALFALVLRTAIRSHPDLAAQPGDLLTAINAQITPDLEQLDLFITAQVVFLENGTRRLRYANAGHCPMLLLAPGRAPLTLEEGGTPLGVTHDETFASHGVAFPPGHALLLLTDGIIETANARGAMFGMEGLAPIVRSLAERPPAEICAQVLAAVDAFGDGRAASDDRTVLVVNSPA